MKTSELKVVKSLVPKRWIVLDLSDALRVSIVFWDFKFLIYCQVVCINFEINLFSIFLA
jgi:hypothetical protein